MNVKEDATERRAVRISGTVQGVGFRPFVYRLAIQHGLSGTVRNDAGEVLIDVEGRAESITKFLDALVSQPPILARIDCLSTRKLQSQGVSDFRIEPSQSDRPGQISVCADIATCSDCLHELFDPADRRYQYPFLNCTNCGPRLTIMKGAPYDRIRTTMRHFPLCETCLAEYSDPANRRFHAQPTACPECGPQLQLLNSIGRERECEEPLARFVTAILQGKIGALKGLGGYHLVCHAENETAVNRLRQRKHREEKPFALMVANIEAAQKFCQIDAAEKRLLQSERAPIVLLRRRIDTDHYIAPSVASGSPCLGVMLPYTPLHHLLLNVAGGAPLVMTSGNHSDEPIAIHDADAVQRLQGIVDLFLIHNRPIEIRCEDSVTRIVAGEEYLMRRSRGYAPQPISLPVTCSQAILATGGQQKGTFTLGQKNQAILSHHLGDLDHFEAFRAFERDIEFYQQLFSIDPVIIAHDLHPDYASTQYATARMEESRHSECTLIPVQHHHAHMASCMVEYGLDEPVIGVTFDGTGYGNDGTLWGGEFLTGDYLQFHRAAHLRYIGMPGGESAIREPWRMAVAYLLDAGCDYQFLLNTTITKSAICNMQTMLRRQLNSPLTSSMGRLFDAIAAIIGLKSHVSYEGQAAIELEWLADQSDLSEPYPWKLLRQTSVTVPQTESSTADLIDVRPLIRAVVQDVQQGVSQSDIARRFHLTVVNMIVEVCQAIREETGLDKVVLSGGVFMNVLLTTQTTRELEALAFKTYRHRLVPANDGGLSLGQLAVAAAMTYDGTERIQSFNIRSLTTDV